MCAMKSVTLEHLSAFADLIAGRPGATAFHCAGFSATRGELLAASERAAAYLASLGFRRGDVLALWLSDGGAWLQFLFGAAHLGVLVVTISTRYHQAEARRAIETARAKGVVAVSEFVGVRYCNLARQIKTEVHGLEYVIEVREARK